ncbi:MAG: hypothetical protein ACOC0D_10285, partial [Spirochaeta sp.]
VVPVVLMVARRVYLPRRVERLRSTWESEKDRDRMDAAFRVVRRRLRPFRPLRPDFPVDVNLILAVVSGAEVNRKGRLVAGENHGETGSDSPRVVLSFNMQDLAHCYLLLFSDLYDEYAGKWWFRLAGRFRVRWFVHIGVMHRTVNRILSHPSMAVLKQNRLLFRAARLILIPLFGIPDLVISFVLSVSVGLVSEGLFRYVYGLILLKIAHYALYLYGGKNSGIQKRIHATLSSKRIGVLARQAEQMIAVERNSEHSLLYEEAVAAYQDFLGERQLGADSRLAKEGIRKRDRLRRFIRRTTRYYAKAYGGRSTTGTQNILEDLTEIHTRIASVYQPGKQDPWRALQALRGREILAFGYLSSILMIHMLLSIPVVGQLAGKSRMQLVVRMSAIVGDETARRRLKQGFEIIRHTTRAASIWRRVHVAAATVVKRKPVLIIPSIILPGIKVGIEDNLRLRIYSRFSRLLLYTWEYSSLGRKPDLETVLWNKE